MENAAQKVYVVSDGHIIQPLLVKLREKEK
jgi:hypothetical protein